MIIIFLFQNVGVVIGVECVADESGGISDVEINGECDMTTESVK